MVMVMDTGTRRRLVTVGLFLVSLVVLIVPTNGFTSNAVPIRSSSVGAPLTQQQRAVRLPAGGSGLHLCTDDVNPLQPDGTVLTSRRSLFHSTATVVAAVASLSIASSPSRTWAAASTTITTSASTTTSPADAAVTRKVFMNVRISRQDGTFYVRDDLPDVPENRVFYGKLIFKLFGKNAPSYVDRFLSYIPTTADSVLEDNPLPSYGRSSFVSFDQAAGLLLGGKIPSLEVTDMNGSPAIRYGGRLLPASLWMDNGNTRISKTDPLPPRIPHTAKGLLTHRILDVTPEFALTCRTDSSFLDGSHAVFGQLQMDDTAEEFLKIVQTLPTYSIDRPSPGTNEETVVDDAAAAVFTAQRAFFRNAAKSFGDARIDKLYEGKLLRRVEVTQVGYL